MFFFITYGITLFCATCNSYIIAEWVVMGSAFLTLGYRSKMSKKQWYQLPLETQTTNE